MLDCNEALERILSATPRFVDDVVALDAAVGRILRQPVVAERDQPPFDRVTMDGIAVRYAALAAGRREFTIAGTQHAGDRVQTLGDDAQCLEVMTGTVMPTDSNCVIPVERVSVQGRLATVDESLEATAGQYLHRQGSDHRQGHTLLSPGRRITPLDVAILASAGLDTLQVAAQPVVCVVSTGNELVQAGQAIEPHQIRLSNGPALVAMLTSGGYPGVTHDHLPDDPALLRERLGRHLEDCDVLILSGGVSMGKADFVPQVLGELGVDVVFHKIAQRPGKPMWFGTGAAGQPVFALPGNPVSTLTCCRHYVLPALRSASGRAPSDPEYAVLTDPYSFSADLTCFLPVRLRSESGGRCLATPVPTNTSGDFAALSGTDGYLELPRGRDVFDAGSAWRLHRWELA